MYDCLNLLNINNNEEQKKIFKNYQKLFLEYNQKINLISKNDEKFLFEKHIFDSLAFNLFYSKYNKKNINNILDIGTGGGFPSVPISLLYPNINVTALDSINKKIKSIECLKEELLLKNLFPVCRRAEEFNEKEKFDVAVSRATAELRIILEYAIPFLKTGGYFVAYKSLKAEEEIKNAKTALKLLNAEVIDKIEYSLPIKEENKRVLLIIRKIKKTPSIYPRQNGIIKKKML